ncbi:hypothetical protein K450DRAFT_234725 [Umbelopsis ramanniana AG]|uniref:Uncharacterized protein n=1 Tax=Umbelopsis ramanniana AG TaxID=1314678 RepID=A0AAD5HDY8_UMBRA|nr:uncharacterized protein K450DRAFT_234725 [Umbelopsis ramanniana AG]KAI8580815.1 hypothetical protein K450DRAFT_234725 [Umbelopsis ramanniana AG]
MRHLTIRTSPMASSVQPRTILTPNAENLLCSLLTSVLLSRDPNLFHFLLCTFLCLNSRPN